MRRFHPAALMLVFGISGLAVGCDGTQGPLAADDALIDAAPNITPAQLLADLRLDPSQEEAVKTKLEALHGVMLEVHELRGESADMTEEDKKAMHEMMGDVHERHIEFMDELSPDQKTQFLENAHSVMANHAEEMDIKEMHEKMRPHLENHELDHDKGEGHELGN